VTDGVLAGLGYIAGSFPLDSGGGGCGCFPVTDEDAAGFGAIIAGCFGTAGFAAGVGLAATDAAAAIIAFFFLFLFFFPCPAVFVPTGIAAEALAVAMGRGTGLLVAFSGVGKVHMVQAANLK